LTSGIETPAAMKLRLEIGGAFIVIALIVFPGPDYFPAKTPGIGLPLTERKLPGAEPDVNHFP
jgi:hypothetical protein